MRRLVCGAACAVVLSTGGVARADNHDEAAALATYDEAKILLAKEDWAGACAKFAESMRLNPRGGTLRRIAVCHEHEGKLAQASADYRRARELAKQAVDVEGKSKIEEIVQAIDASAAALEPRIPKLTVTVTNPPKGVKISRGGAEMSSTSLGIPLPIDPGNVEVVVSAPGFKEQRKSIKIAESASASLTFTLEVAPPDATKPRPGPEETKTPTWAWISGGVGIALVATAVGFRFSQSAAETRLKEVDLCNENNDCPIDPASDNAAKNIGAGMFIGLGSAGLVAIGIGVYGIVKGSSSSAPSQTSLWKSVTPIVGPNGGAVSFRHSF